MVKKPLQWHPAFQAVLQIELAEDREYLQFMKEYNLTDKPLRIDTLIIKLEKGRVVKKNIGRIFRQYNVVEYKGPEDYHSINDFYRVMAYAGILQSNTEREREIPPEELTVTLVGNHYPRKLVEFLKKTYHADVTKPSPGIYYVSGLMFPMQIVVQKQLSGRENVWLSRLRQDLTRETDIDTLVKAYKGKDKDPLYSAAMDLIVRANWKVYEEGAKMCDALNELVEKVYAEKLKGGRLEAQAEGRAKGRAEGIAEGRAEGKAEAVLELLLDTGAVPESLRKQIMSQRDEATLSKWLKLAASASGLNDFISQMGS